MIDVILDSLIDSLKLLPFLFLSYLAVEYIEHRMSDSAKAWIYGAGWAGPILGSLIGIIPQCGFSAAAAGLFAARVISPGTLLAVFLSTSDEMLPLMLSQGIGADLIIRVLAVKVIAGAVIGLLADFAAVRLNLWKPSVVRPAKISRASRRNTSNGVEKKLHRMGEMDSDLDDGENRNYRRNKNTERDLQGIDSEDAIHHMCEHGHCQCEKQGIFRASLHHTAQTAVFLFLISLVLGFGMDWFQGTAFSRGIFAAPGIQAALAGLIGMIPNCAASVLITQLYLEGVLASGALFAGLLCGAGTGLLVLFRENGNQRQNLLFTLVLYVSGTLAGMLAGAMGFL
ncbi:MAG: arsenic efflux protein [Lachnospiraceae bacterium]|nr:arsenic efflux protein [Lachnospiraceae bacterium]